MPNIVPDLARSIGNLWFVFSELPTFAEKSRHDPLTFGSGCAKFASTMSESLTDLARARKAMGLTVAELAIRIGASRQSVYNWERGAKSPNPMARRAIAATFFLPPETIDSWFNKAA